MAHFFESMNSDRNGEFEHIYDNGDIYRGEWLHGLRHGVGTFTTAQGKLIIKYLNR
jgi:hypothetical protein